MKKAKKTLSAEQTETMSAAAKRLAALLVATIDEKKRKPRQ